MKTIASYSEGRNNNFNLIRFLAAGLVILAHSYTLTNHDQWANDPIANRISTDGSAFAVNVFFIISGYLICMSFLRQKGATAYITARILRIFPGLFIAIVFSIFVIGLLFTTLEPIEFLSTWDIYEYLLINSTLVLNIVQLRYYLPEVFIGNPYGPTINGSLWTLPYEVWMYIFLLGIGLTGILKQRKRFNILFALFILLFYFVPQLIGDAAFFQRFDVYIRFSSFFLVGVFFFMNRDYIPMNFFLGIILVTLTTVFRNTTIRDFLLLFSMAYGTFWFSYVPGGFIRKFNKLGDYSYGLYIYAYPIQQSLIAINPNISPIMTFTLASILTIFFAIISWHFLEKPALKLKDTVSQKIISIFSSSSPL